MLLGAGRGGRRGQLTSEVLSGSCFVFSRQVGTWKDSREALVVVGTMKHARDLPDAVVADLAPTERRL